MIKNNNINQLFYLIKLFYIENKILFGNFYFFKIYKLLNLAKIKISRYINWFIYIIFNRKFNNFYFDKIYK